ncbi:MAG: dTDP-glucose 4,6-dehydratase [Candidatus Omnitrophica bacterium]|nr:dTDP-glucose 4,6-dehydratase [Candidatus Omnitrophota bacterium]
MTAHTPENILVTGGAGFIGSNLVRYLLRTDPQARVVNLDKLTYAGNPENLAGLAEAYPARYRMVRQDISDQSFVEALFQEENFSTVIHLAAESHVDRSIEMPLEFVRANVLGTAVLLQAAEKFWHGRKAVRFHHVSTDEVYGSLGPTGFFTEGTPYDPSSPYSASKAGADHLVRAWARTYGLPVTMSICSNNYGPYQFPEKLLPLMIMNALSDKALPVYGDGKNIRDWLYVEDHCRAIDHIVRHAPDGSVYNVGGRNEWKNIDIVYLLCDTLMAQRPRVKGHYRDLITFVQDRPGHDRRYAIDATRIEQELGWRPEETFETGLTRTVSWYLEHQDWVTRIREGRYSGTRLGLRHEEGKKA